MCIEDGVENEFSDAVYSHHQQLELFKKHNIVCKIYLQEETDVLYLNKSSLKLFKF